MIKPILILFAVACYLAPLQVEALTDDFYDYRQMQKEEVIEPERTFTEQDVNLLARVLWAEARGECREGQLMVAQTILDRMNYGEWGNTLESVVFASGQFVVGRYVNDYLLEVARAALNGERYNENAIIFHFRMTASMCDWWSPRLGRIGAHTYYGWER